MNEIYIEESSTVKNPSVEKIKYNVYLVMAIFAFIVVAAILILIYFGFDFSAFDLILFVLAYVVPILIFSVFGTIMLKFKNKTFLEYDYSLNNDEISIDVTYARKKRRNVIIFLKDRIITVGKTGSVQYKKFKNFKDVAVHNLYANVKNKDKTTYYLYVNHNGSKLILNIDCSERFIKYLSKLLNRDNIEKGIFDK